MNAEDLEGRLARARERVRRAIEALAPKHRGGEMEEYRAAFRAQLEAERALALFRGEPACMPLDWSPAWDAGAPCPHVVASGRRTVLVYLVADGDPSWDGTTVRVVEPASATRERLAVVEFQRCYGHRFGGPNDEVMHGHPLHGRGMEPYGAHLVANSPWIAAERRTHSVQGQFRAETWEQLRHYMLLFHDDVFECLARGHSIERIEATFEQGVALAVSRLFGTA